MKKAILPFLFSVFMIQSQTFAQYSNATVSGPWLGLGNNPIYLIFDGNGVVDQVGNSLDSLHPAGTYTVSASGVLNATVTLSSTNTILVVGQMLNDSTATLQVDSNQGASLMLKVSNPGALAGSWTGLIYDTSSHSSRNVQFDINSNGAVTSASGLVLDSGKIFLARDTFAGLIVTSDVDCRYTYISVFGILSNDSMLGYTDLGPVNQGNNTNDSCGAFGYVQFVKTPTAIAVVNGSTDFSVYPNPFNDQVEIVMNNPAEKTEADLFDVLGRKVMSQQWGPAQTKIINTVELSKGLYLLALTANGKTTTLKIVKN